MWEIIEVISLSCGMVLGSIGMIFLYKENKNYISNMNLKKQSHHLINKEESYEEKRYFNRNSSSSIAE